MNHVNKIRYIESDWAGDSILSFKEPRDNILEKIGKYLESLDIKPFRESLLATHSPEEAIKGRRSYIMTRLSKVLIDDYRDNIADKDLDFEYHVFTSNQQPGAIHIKTRLFYSDRDGDVLYGRMIQRVAEDEYFLWIDD